MDLLIKKGLVQRSMFLSLHEWNWIEGEVGFHPMKLEFGYGHDRGHMSESGLEICLDSI